eukprot:468473-Prymnesium_polylepis.1
MFSPTNKLQGWHTCAATHFSNGNWRTPHLRPGRAGLRAVVAPCPVELMIRSTLHFKPDLKRPYR